MGITDSGDLLTILRACLVEGFAGRTPAGWTMPFSDLPNKKACFKSATGDTMRLDDSLEYRWASVLGFKEMTDLDTGTEQFPDSTQMNADQHLRVFKRYSTSSIYNGWMVVATDDWFYFIGLHNTASNSYPSGFYFGKYDAANPAFTENSIITGQVITIASATATSCDYGLYIVNATWYVRRGYRNGVKPVAVKNYRNTIAAANPNPATGKLEMVKAEIKTEDAYAIRMGDLHNRYHILGSTNSGYRGGEVFEIDAVKYLIISEASVAYAIVYDVEVG